MASSVLQTYLLVYVGEKRSQYESRGWHWSMRMSTKAKAYAVIAPIADHTAQENMWLCVPADRRLLNRSIDTLMEHVLSMKQSCATQLFYAGSQS